MVLEMEATVERMRSELARMRKRTSEMERRLSTEMERLRRASGGELVPYGAYRTELDPRSDQGVQVPVRRGGRGPHRT
jgi:hypothetical protein